MRKKAESQMMWILVGTAMALLVLVVYSFITGGFARKVAQQFGLVSDENEQRLNCTVLPPGGPLDPDKDGLKNIPNCDKFKRT